MRPIRAEGGAATVEQAGLVALIALLMIAAVSAFAAGCSDSAKSKLLKAMAERNLIVMDSPSALQIQSLMPYAVLSVFQYCTI